MSKMQFNLTHSGEMAAIALTLDCPLGLDLEAHRPLLDLANIANQFFCIEEAAEVLALPPGERELAFFRCWTRKEAYLKATGEGLSLPLHSFRVSVQANTPARFIHLEGDKKAAESWTLHDLSLVPNYAAALAYQAAQRCVTVHAVVDPEEILNPVC